MNLLTVFILAAVLIGTVATTTFVYAQEDNQQKTVDKATIKTNDTDIHITCTSNMPDLVSCD